MIEKVPDGYLIVAMLAETQHFRGAGDLEKMQGQMLIFQM